ncbi:MAG: hypothetical protein KGI79_02780 [Patescibacteria group bacterium]|nr:hypothetical protein [Patescibacteria group bacterium]MDE2116775.1 hypothetical protein [Patescibacteria group bacterium]
MKTNRYITLWAFALTVSVASGASDSIPDLLPREQIRGCIVSPATRITGGRADEARPHVVASAPQAITLNVSIDSSPGISTWRFGYIKAPFVAYDINNPNAMAVPITSIGFAVSAPITYVSIEAVNGASVIYEDPGSAHQVSYAYTLQPGETHRFVVRADFGLQSDEHSSVFAALEMTSLGVQGNFSSLTVNGPGVGASIPVQVVSASAPLHVRIINSSARGNVTGFVVTSDDSLALAAVLIRAVGPTLGKFGVTGFAPNPSFTLYDGAGDVVGNAPSGWSSDVISGWSVSLAEAYTGAFPLITGSGDAAEVFYLSPGAYTVQTSGQGQIMSEVYLADMRTQ